MVDPMAPSMSDALPDDILNRLSPDQRHRVYEEEKSRLKESSPGISKLILFLYIATYVLGCALIYFGIGQAMTRFVFTWQWVLTPEPDFFDQLLCSAIQLVRPLLAMVFVIIPVAVPCLLLAGVAERSWKWLAGLLKSRKG